MTRNSVIKILLLIGFAFILVGCTGQKIYEKTGFILQTGIEEGKDAKYLFTMTLPVISGAKENEITIIRNESNLLREAREKARLVSGKILEGGKVQLIHFSEDLAQKGIHDLLKTFERNPESPVLANVIVVEGSPSDLIDKAHKFKDKPRVAFYITQLIDNARNNGYTPETRVFRFNIDYFSPGIDPITPLIAVKQDEDEIEVTGCALFSGDKMVGKLNTIETGLLQALRDQKKSSEYYYENNQQVKGYGKNAAIMLQESKRKINIDLKKDKLTFKIYLMFEADLDEYTGKLNIDNTKNQKHFENQVSEAVKNDCNKIIKYLQEIEADPIGLGEMIRVKHNDYWKNTDWKKVYKEANIYVDATVHIKQYGDMN